ncbi:hydrogenase [Hyperthermus butylicus]|uniref:NiFe hydrogenase n=1 Tax=Hyperthermus butylicus (strain DSM 5456 / JCM 9403 / PLM1-5) TaxID=415426 RepID=A2BMI5_HYPBU|nr:hydrogenase [Hyperthermus butylicus]ABM81196.1 NiFe hydrogenase [Hyperthermus butylicus DSM 5456]
MLELRLSRRQFLKLAGTTALLASLDWRKLIRRAFAELETGGISLVWFEAQDCAGDTTSLIQATEPDIVEVLAGLTNLTPPGAVVLPFHETVMPEWGFGSIAHLLLALGGVYDPYVLILEGAMPPDEDLTGIKGTNMLCYIGDYETVMESLEKLRRVVEGKMKPNTLLPVVDAVKAISPERAKIIAERLVEKIDEVEKATEECMKGLSGEDVVTCARWFACLMKRAIGVVSFGNCASYGGVVGNTVAFSWARSDLLEDYESTTGYKLYREWARYGWSFSPTGGVGFFPDPVRGYKGFAKILAEQAPEPFRSFAKPYVDFIDGKCVPDKPSPDASCKPAVAVPGCPSNGNAQLKTLTNLILWVKGELPLPELDQYWRPKIIFGGSVHEQCPRNEKYRAGILRSEPGEPSGACLFSVGCKGPISNCPYNKIGWVNGVGGPTRTGGVCIGCTMPGFMDAYEPYYKPLPAPVKPEASAATELAAGAAVVGVLAAYGIRKLAGGEKEKEKGA